MHVPIGKLPPSVSPLSGLTDLGCPASCVLKMTEVFSPSVLVVSGGEVEQSFPITLLLLEETHKSVHSCKDSLEMCLDILFCFHSKQEVT